MKKNTQLFIKGFEVDLAGDYNISITKVLKDIKEFSKSKTPFTLPISVLHTTHNHDFFGNMFNINDIGGFDKYIRYSAEIVENGETVLAGLIKLESITKDYYRFILYKDTVNLSKTSIGDALITGNVDKSKDIVFANDYAYENTRPNLREKFFHKEPRTDGKGINVGFIKYSENYLGYGNRDFIMTPSVAVRELLEEILKKQGKTISFSPQIEKYINNMYLPFNGDYNKFCSPWQAIKYRTTATSFSSSDYVPLKVVDHMQITYDKFTNTWSSGAMDNITIKTLGTYHIKWHCVVNRSQANGTAIATPRINLYTTNIHPFTNTDLKLERTDIQFETDGFDIKLDDNNPRFGDYETTFTLDKGETSIYFGFKTDDLKDYGKLFINTNAYVEITKIDSYYNEETVATITANKILPQNYKQSDFFNDIVNTFNANIIESNNNVHLTTFDDFHESKDRHYYDWSEKISDESIMFKPLSNVKNEVIEPKFLKSDDFYQEDYADNYHEEMYDFSIDKGLNKLITKQLNYASTTIDGDVTHIGNIAMVVNKDNKLTTVMKPRILFIDSYKPLPTEAYSKFGTDNGGLEGSKRDTSITHYIYYTNRFKRDINDKDNLKLVFKDDSVYKNDEIKIGETTILDTNINLYNKFHQKESIIYANPDNMFLSAKFNLTSKDVADIQFNDIIYIRTDKNGDGYYMLNSIKNYTTNSNKLTKVELIGVNPTIIGTKQPISQTKELKYIKLSVGNKEKQAQAQGISSGGGSGSGNSGLDITDVNALIADGIANKLDKDAKAADSELLDGHDSTYFLHDDANYAKLDRENTFTESQTIDKNLLVKGNFEVDGNFVTKNTTDLAISDNIIDLNKGESGSGVSARYSGIQVDRGSLLSKGLVFDEHDDKIKFGDFDTRSGAISNVGTSNITVIGLDTTENLIGKEVKIFTLQEVARVLTVTSWNNNTKVLGLNGDLSGIDNTWNWRILIAEDLTELATIDNTDMLDNGIPIYDTNRQLLKKSDIKIENGEIISSKFISGILGKGFKFGLDAETDNLSIRKSLSVNTFINNKINIQNGDMIISDSATILTATDETTYWKITSDEELPFRDNQILRFQNSIGGGNVRYYEAKVNAIEWYKNQGRNKEMEIIITDGSDTPQTGDLLTRWDGGLLYLNSSDSVHGAYLDVVRDGVTKARFGRLTGINDVDFGQLQGDGAYIENLYGKGDMILGNKSSIDWSSVIGGDKAISDKSVPRTTKTVDLKSLDEDTYYPITINMDSRVSYNISVSRTLGASYGVPSYSTHASGFSCIFGWRSNGSGWGTSSIRRSINVATQLWAGDIPVGGDIGQVYTSSKEYIYMRGGSEYIVEVEGRANVDILLHTTSYSYGGVTIAPKSSVSTPAVERLTHIDSHGIYAGKAVLGGFDIDTNMIRSQRGGLISSTGRKGHISMSNTTTAYGSDKYFYNGDRTLQGFSIGSDTDGTAYNLVMGQMMSSRSNIRTDYFGIQMMDHTSKEYFALGFNTKTGASYNKIASWDFDNTKLSSPNNELVLDAVNSKITLGNNKFKLQTAKMPGRSNNGTYLGSDNLKSFVWMDDIGTMELKSTNILIRGNAHIDKINGLRMVHGTFNSSVDGYQPVTVPSLNKIYSVNVVMVSSSGSGNIYGANEIKVATSGGVFWYNRNDNWSGVIPMRYVAWGE